MGKKNGIYGTRDCCCSWKPAQCPLEIWAVNKSHQINSSWWRGEYCRAWERLLSIYADVCLFFMFLALDIAPVSIYFLAKHLPVVPVVLRGFLQCWAAWRCSWLQMKSVKSELASKPLYLPCTETHKIGTIQVDLDSDTSAAVIFLYTGIPNRVFFPLLLQVRKWGEIKWGSPQTAQTRGWMQNQDILTPTLLLWTDRLSNSAPPGSCSLSPIDCLNITR